MACLITVLTGIGYGYGASHDLSRSYSSHQANDDLVGQIKARKTGSTASCNRLGVSTSPVPTIED